MAGTRILPRTRAKGPERVLIVGGGATGLVSLRNLVEEVGSDSEGSYPLFEPLLVERRDDVGGVWYWSDETYSLERSIGADKTQGLSPLFDPKGQPHWPSPAYLNLRGNVLPEFLEFSGKKFDPPAHGETFPSLQETHQYLKGFAEPYRRYIRCGVEVLRVQELAEDQGWQVTLKDWRSNVVEDGAGAVSFTPKVEVHKFDRVIVAAGWYDTPYYPDVPGIQEAKKAGHIHHCKHYRDSTPYVGNKVVVVGNNNSANEVAAHLAPFNSVSHPVYRSSKTAPVEKCPSLPDERIKDVGMITNYQLVPSTNPSNRGTTLNLTLLDGSIISNVDYVILGTGYGQKYPWLYVLTDAARSWNTGEVELLTPDHLQGTRVPYMYNHALYSKFPRLTLAFVGLVISTMPFSFNDLISAWITAVWSGKITSVPASLPLRLKFETDRLSYIYNQRSKTCRSTLDPNNPSTYAGYHLLGGSLKDGPPSELHFASELYQELKKVDPERVQKWNWKWDQEREQRQNQMYKSKKIWLEQNRERIRMDPFDLLGNNKARYSYLINELVHPDWRQKQSQRVEKEPKPNL
ncbi:related to FMO1 - flavin-containing monooxygenase [Ustilago trichophora]|uniref:Related to FMO1 - flavin-containing monooxygenase n=1 Tax=Ustilago trichophora TaxID=86804 RepID=A0A5C3E0N7_9BASI|nr:related to FMO1 - flavin-containing monooxygenase [Ustilago trichophora]